MATGLVEDALADTRVVFVMGARQTGKSTLLEGIARQRWGQGVITLDDAATRSAAEADPTSFIANLATPAAIDEVQRVPDLLLAIKQRVDRDQQPGQFLLSGSSNVKTNRKVKD
ncbi:MAG: AAA family ATPase, partial [Propionibacteriaceae bacterium]|nr:AAA family ATPase [Propionibacteriaceae bacterium]